MHTMELKSVTRSDKIMLFTNTWINLKNIMLRKVSQKERSDLIHYVCFKEKKRKLQIDKDNRM